MTNTEFQDANLDSIHLGKGRHQSAAEGMCPMEAAAWLAGEKHSDHPDCTCPVIAAYVRPISDWADDEQRQQLRAFLPRLIGSRSADHVVRRAEFLVRQAATVFLPLIYGELQEPEIAADLRAIPINATMDQLSDAVHKARQCLASGNVADVDGVKVMAAIAVEYALMHSRERIDDAADAAVFAATVYITAAISHITKTYIAMTDVYTASVAAHVAVAYCAHAKIANYVAELMAARNTIRRKFWDAALAALDGALAIGPAGDRSLTPAMIERLKMYQALKQKSA
jgi:hypothetical protein